MDFTPTAVDYRSYRRPFPPMLFQRLRQLGIGLAGQTILDVGSGTGLLAEPLNMASCQVIAMDVSHTLLSSVHLPHLRGVAGRAEVIPFADESFDIVTAAQCWHWFDRHRAPAEIKRVLRAGGRLAVVYQMHIPLPGSVAEATEQLILRHRPRWRHANSAGINGQVLRDMQVNGFTDIETFSFDFADTFSHGQWRGYIRSTSAVGASMPADRLALFERDHIAMLGDWPSTLQIPHRVFAAVASKSGCRL